MSELLIPQYGVRLQEGIPVEGRQIWKLVSATHLEPAANVGRHNVYVTAVDDLGNRVMAPDVMIGWTWAGRRNDEPAAPLALDKRDGEPPGNVPLYSPAMHAEVWIEDGVNPSDHVINLHTDHGDELGPNGETWNSIGHHSYNLIFQRVGGTMPPPPPDEKEDKVITITSDNMTISVAGGPATSGPGTVTIIIKQGQGFARG